MAGFRATLSRCICVTAIAWQIAGQALSQCHYGVTVIQGPPHPTWGAPATIPTGLNSLGHVVGYYFYLGEDERGFLWTPEGGFTTLPMPPGASTFTPFDINDAGVIVGEADVSSLGGYRGFIYENGSYTYLEPVANAIWSAGYAINNSGLIVGVCDDPRTGPRVATQWLDGVPLKLELPLGPNSTAYDVNDNGVIVGWMGPSLITGTRAFVWDAGVVTTIDAIPQGTTSRARAVDVSGSRVVGSGRLTEPITGRILNHALYWDGEIIQDLGTFPGFRHSGAIDVNDSGTIVGQAWEFGGNPNISVGFRWQAGQLRDLNELLMGPVVEIQSALRITNSGTILVQGRSSGTVLSALLIPIGAFTSDFDADGDVDLQDLATLLSDYGCSGNQCVGDVDQNGDCSLADLAIVLSEFGINCQ